jgi:aromatic amino acid aminotransferase I / 2-aminoadipate transaminase
MVHVDLEVALNYSQSTGSPQLLRFVTEHVEVRTISPIQSYHSTN